MQLYMSDLILILCYSYINIGEFLKWFVSETPYLIHDTTKAPHITGTGVVLVVYGLKQKFRKREINFHVFLRRIFIAYLWGCPFHWYLSPMGDVVTVIHHPRHPKIAYLCNLK